MSGLHEQVAIFSEKFCDTCFQYLMDKKDETSEDINIEKYSKEILEPMINIIHNAGKNKITFVSVFAVQGVRFAFTKMASQKSMKGETLSDGIVTENEIRNLFNRFEEYYEKSEKPHLEDLKYTFQHIFNEINYLCSEYDGIALQSYNLNYRMIEKNNSDHFAQLDSSYENMKKEIGQMGENIEGLKESFSEEVKMTSEKISTAKRELFKATKESKNLLNNTISILGLFMTIAAAIFGGVTITNEVLKTISVDVLTSILFVLATGFILVNLIFLFSFIIAKMSGKDIGMQCQHFSVSTKELEERYKIKIDNSFIEENLYELHNCLFCDSHCGFYQKFKCRYQYMLYIEAMFVVLFVLLGIVWIVRNTFYDSWASSVGETQVKQRLFKIALSIAFLFIVIIVGNSLRKKYNNKKPVAIIACILMGVISICLIIFAGYQFFILSDGTTSISVDGNITYKDICICEHEICTCKEDCVDEEIPDLGV